MIIVKSKKLKWLGLKGAEYHLWNMWLDWWREVYSACLSDMLKLFFFLLVWWIVKCKQKTLFCISFLLKCLTWWVETKYLNISCSECSEVKAVTIYGCLFCIKDVEMGDELNHLPSLYFILYTLLLYVFQISKCSSEFLAFFSIFLNSGNKKIKALIYLASVHPAAQIIVNP